MMATLLEIKGVIKRYYTKYETYIRPALKFILALITFLLINSKIGFMKSLSSPFIAVVLAAVCAALPLNGVVVFSGILMIAHAYALSLEACAVTLAIIAVIYLLYFRISSKMAVLLIITPLCYYIGIPYVVPLLGGLLFGVGAAVPAGCGAVIYYLVDYMNRNSTSLGTGDLEGGAVKMVSLVEGVVTNKEMFLCVAAMVLTVVAVYFIRRLSIDHSWEIAIGIGIVLNIVIHLVGGLVTKAAVEIIPLLLGIIISALIAFVVKFFVFSVDYSRVERVQFEDDEYYYYVKAVPKNVIATPKKTVKKIITQKKQPKIIKRIDGQNESKE